MMKHRCEHIVKLSDWKTTNRTTVVVITGSTAERKMDGYEGVKNEYELVRTCRERDAWKNGVSGESNYQMVSLVVSALDKLL